MARSGCGSCWTSLWTKSLPLISPRLRRARGHEAAPAPRSTPHRFAEPRNRAPVARCYNGPQGFVEIGVGQFAAGHPIGQAKIDILAADDEFVRRRTMRIECDDIAFSRSRGEAHDMEEGLTGPGANKRIAADDGAQFGAAAQNDRRPQSVTQPNLFRDQ